jgi:hypothetical protein
MKKNVFNILGIGGGAILMTLLENWWYGLAILLVAGFFYLGRIIEKTNLYIKKNKKRLPLKDNGRS